VAGREISVKKYVDNYLVVINVGETVLDGESSLLEGLERPFQ